MRPKERIDIIEPILRTNLKELLNVIPNLNDYIEVDSTITVIDDNWKDIIKAWKKNPDLRFMQLLTVLEYVPNVVGFWFNLEESDWIIDKKLAEAEDILLWGVNFDVDNNRLPKTIWKPISSLNTVHIQAILKGDFTRNIEYIKLFNKVLASRGEEEINI
jgi:hypothetical protein